MASMSDKHTFSIRKYFSSRPTSVHISSPYIYKQLFRIESLTWDRFVQVSNVDAKPDLPIFLFERHHIRQPEGVLHLPYEANFYELVNFGGQAWVHALSTARTRANILEYAHVNTSQLCFGDIFPLTKVDHGSTSEPR